MYRILDLRKRVARNSKKKTGLKDSEVGRIVEDLVVDFYGFCLKENIFGDVRLEKDTIYATSRLLCLFFRRNFDFLWDTVKNANSEAEMRNSRIQFDSYKREV